MRASVVAVFLTFATPAAAQPLSPIRLASGANHIQNAVGLGENAIITLTWRDNGNAWGYDIYSVSVHGSIVTISGSDQIKDIPHLGEDMIKSVRFSRGVVRGRPTIILLTAERQIHASTYDPSPTIIQTYALAQNSEGIGTPYEFVPMKKYRATVGYCNAEMALKTEVGLPLPRTYSGKMTRTGC